MNTILRLGHLGLLDSAPLLVAQRQGYFAEAGLKVELSCELGLASLTAKLMDQRLAGACVPALLPLTWSLGTYRARPALNVILITSYQDLAIAHRSRPTTPTAPARRVRFGVLSSASAARFVVQRWLAQSRFPGAESAALVPVSLSQIVSFLSDGLIDGFCAPDPLAGFAALTGPAITIVPSGDLCPMHPGSVLALHHALPAVGPAEIETLAACLRRACRYCADPAHQAELWALVRDQAPLAQSLAEYNRDGAIGARLPYVASGIRYTGPSTNNGLDAAGASFLEDACRAVSGLNLRGTDVRSEVARRYRPAA